MEIQWENLAEAIAEHRNATIVDIDDKGDIWVVQAGHGHWMTDEEKATFLTWLLRQFNPCTYEIENEVSRC